MQETLAAQKSFFSFNKQYEAKTGQHFIHVPVVQYLGSTAARIGKGNTNIPNFKIAKWMDRPAALPFKDDLPEKPVYQDHQAPLAQSRPQRADYVKPAVLVDNLDPNDSINLYHPQTQGKIERWNQTLKNRILLENYYLPGDLKFRIGAFVEHYNHQRYHESISNLTPAHVYFGRGHIILMQREKIKRQTIEQRRLQYWKNAA